MSNLPDELKTYQKAMREEYEVASTGTSDDIADKARSKLASLLPEATQELQTIIRNGDKDDAVRLSGIKLVFEYTLGKPGPKTTKESDIERVINMLTATETTTEA